MEEIIRPEDLPKDKKHLVIFDDAITLINQSTIESFFTRSRHNGANVIYLTQSYFSLTRMIKLNSNLIILFKLNPRNLNDVYNAVIGSIMDKKEFMQLAKNVFSKKYSYIVINKDEDQIITDLFKDYESDSDSENDSD